MPCFLFIFLGAPYIERLRSNQTVSASLTGITAAVVGVIANLTLRTLFTTRLMIFKLRWSVLRVLGICAALGPAVAGGTAIW